jgi:esterase/lipase
LIVSDKKIKSEQIIMERAKNDFDYYAEEIKRFEGDKKNEMANMLVESTKQIKRSEDKIYKLQQRAVRVHDFMNSNFVMYMCHKNNVRRLEEAKMEKDNATN